MTKVFKFRRRWLVAGIILLAGGVVFEEWYRAATIAAHYPQTDLTHVVADNNTEFVLTNKNFSAAVDLWLNPGTLTYGADKSYADLMFKSDLRPANFDQLVTHAPGGESYTSFLTMADKDLTYALFSIGNFKATLNMTTVKPTPQAILPTQIKTGFGGSFDF